MTPEEIRSDVMTHISASWTDTAIVFPNYEYVPTGVSWIRPVVIMGETAEDEKGSDGVGLRSGVLMNSIFTVGNSGDRIGLQYATTFEALFRRRDIGEVMFGEPYTREIGIDPNGYYHIMVTVPFYAWVGE